MCVFLRFFGWRKKFQAKKKASSKNVNFFLAAVKVATSKFSSASSKETLPVSWSILSWKSTVEMTISHREIYGELMGLYYIYPHGFLNAWKLTLLPVQWKNSNVWMKMSLLSILRIFLLAMLVYWRVQVLCRNFQVLAHPPKQKDIGKFNSAGLASFDSNHLLLCPQKTQTNPAHPSKTKKYKLTKKHLPETNSSQLKIGRAPKGM